MKSSENLPSNRRLQPKFLADGMLGKLTRWLRILGYDVKYAGSSQDQQIKDVAKAENRILLTKDLKLIKQSRRRGIITHLVRGISNAENLAQLAIDSFIILEVDMTLTRCPKCNTELNLIKKEAAKGKIPEKTFIYQDSFWLCSSCSKIYWKGSHWKKIEETITTAKKIALSYEESGINSI